MIIVFLIIAGYWLKYRSIVNAKPKAVPQQIIDDFPLAAQVNSFIGTGGVPWTCAYNFPGASMPFGVMRLGPETESFIRDARALNTSGYFYGDNKIIGFSHTRLIGTGATDGGHFLVLPLDAGTVTQEDPVGEKYPFSHENERAYPGYYNINFPDQGIQVELTATRRTGYHRYTFSSKTKPAIMLDITHAMGDARSEDGYLELNADHRSLQGHVRTFGSFAGRYGGITVYFAGQFSAPYQNSKSWKNGHFSMDHKILHGDTLTAVFDFAGDHADKTILLRLAISHVSIENAWQNLATETDAKSFDDVRREALHAWEDRLNSIQVSGGRPDQRAVFYTALYRCFQMPTIFNDVNGAYKGFDKAVHQIDSNSYFTDMSIWDTFRTVHPLYNLIARKDQLAMVRSLVLMARQGGWLPRWPSGYGYTNSMLGSAADIVISEAWQKGIRDFDIDFAYENIKKIARASTPREAPFSGRRGNDDCIKYGYCPADSMRQAVSRTLEYSWSDMAISRLATALGKMDDASIFAAKAAHFKNVWNPETQYFQPRNADGSFVKEFRPLMLTYLYGSDKYTNDYVEGSALQWRWGPFYDAQGLISLFKNRAYFVQQLNDFFAKADGGMGTWNPGSYYWHGNEPDIHATYLFNAAGRADLTQKWVRWIIEKKYGNRYDGLDGNDDGGTLSAWYVFSALGFYPVAGTDRYELGAPLFEMANIRLGEATLMVETKNYAPDNMYVNKVWLNDRLLDRTWITHEEIACGGILTFEMSDRPAIK